MSGTAKTFNNPLEKRLTKHQSIKRQTKIASRRIVADRLQTQINALGHYTINFRQKTLWQRLKWLFTGK